MNMLISNRGHYRVIRILEDIAVTSNMSDLRPRVAEILDSGGRNVAIAFTDESYLSSRNASVLIACFEMIKDHGGELAIIRPNPTIHHLLTIIDLDGVIKIVASDESLKEDMQTATAP